MHPKVKVAVREYPMYRHFFANVNNAIRQGVRELGPRELLMYVTGRGDNVNVYDFAYLIQSLLNAGVMTKRLEVRAFEDETLLQVVRGMDGVDPMPFGRVLLPNKDVDYTEFSDDPSEFAYFEVKYTFADLYGEDGR